MTDRARLGWVLAAALLAASAPAAATTLLPADVPPPLTRGPFELHPYAGDLETYDSNISLARSPVSAWINTVSAGFQAPGMIGDRSRYQLSYDLADRFYSHNPGIGSGVIQGLDGRYWYHAPSGLGVRLRDSYLNTIDQGSTELTDLRRRWQNLIGGDLAYEPDDGRVLLQADFNDTRYKYVSDDPTLRQQLDRYEQLIGVKAGWQLQPKTVAYTQYHRELIHYTDGPSPSRNSKGNLVDVGLKGQLTPKIEGTAQVGLVQRLYDEAPAAGQDRNTRNVTALVDVSYSPLERTNVDLKFTRSLEESAYDINQFYIATAGLLALSHRFPWRLYSRVYVGMERDKYPSTTQVGTLGVNRRDDNYQTGLDAEYPIGDRLTLDASYLYRARFSRDQSEQFNYNDQVTTVSARLAF